MKLIKHLKKWTALLIIIALVSMVFYGCASLCLVEGPWWIAFVWIPLVAVIVGGSKVFGWAFDTLNDSKNAPHSKT